MSLVCIYGLFNRKIGSEPNILNVSYFLFESTVEEDPEKLNTLIKNLQTMKEKDFSVGPSKTIDFDQKYRELQENIRKPNELKEYEDFDMKCIENSLHQQRTEIRRKLSNKKNRDIIIPAASNMAASSVSAVAEASTNTGPISTEKHSSAVLQRKRPNLDAEIRPCEPNER